MDLSYSLKEIASITGGTLFPGKDKSVPVRELLIDSRRLVNPESTLFIAIISGRNDGHKFITELYERGVRSFLVSRPVKEFPEAGFILVENTLEALQKLGAHHRSRFNIPVIGITGSNGKTIVKEWLFQLMNPDKKIVRSPKSYNSQIGVPLSVWKMEPENDLALFEAGISLPGEMEKLEPVIRPTVGIFTNIGHAHDEGFRDAKEKIREKMRLFTNCESLVYCRDHNGIHMEIIADPSLAKVNTFTWSNRQEADLKIVSRETDISFTILKGIFQGMEISATIPFSDEASLENACHCWATMLLLGYSPEVISFRMKKLAPIAMRLELKEAINHCSLINDSYNSDINSLGIALDFLNQQTQHKKKTIILSDILQSGREPGDLYTDISRILRDKGIDHIIGIGNEISRQAGCFPMEKTFYPSTDSFLELFPFSSFRDEAILVKGARIFEFERIIRVLQQKSHETILEINLDAMVHNLNHYRSKLAPGTKTMIMVKAFSYGSGSFEIANLLQFHRADYLAVAYADEGVELRKAGITLPVMVMNPEEESFDLLLKFNLEPEIYSFRVLEMLENALAASQETPDSHVCIHLKIDTGMHRLGFDPSETGELIARLKKSQYLQVMSVFSHLAASEDPAEDDFTRTQIRILKEVSAQIQTGLGYSCLVHIQNSAGITRFPDVKMGMVRLGIGLYGVGFDDNEQHLLRNVSTLKTIISQIKFVKAGETIGYNRKGIAEKDLAIAILPIGYADGFSRRLGNGRGKVMIGGQTAPTIGNISMDTCMVDITEISSKTGKINEGDEVIIFGDDFPITRLARDLDTIPYEVLTGISRRVKRVYYHE
ncbi:MAG: bifunctional UDP-N-acetylmuramoyl-tripeptide:D-alanyl-D-alanine ligase/alanine racemase [Bacteroidetes bacterium]|nr:bifunctional UDP-N-acetylmuramoyl-tripeptide:D-alanyl-D-alanine ligase/alanine racemase [Bacteroidota bacterium]